MPQLMLFELVLAAAQQKSGDQKSSAANVRHRTYLEGSPALCILLLVTQLVV